MRVVRIVGVVGAVGVSGVIVVVGAAFRAAEAIYLFTYPSRFHPSELEFLAMSSVDDVAAWLGLMGSDANQPRHSLFKLLGIKGPIHHRLLAAIDEADFKQALGNWAIGQEAPSPAVRGQAGTVWRVCRVLRGVEFSASTKAALHWI